MLFFSVFQPIVNRREGSNGKKLVPAFVSGFRTGNTFWFDFFSSAPQRAPPMFGLGYTEMLMFGVIALMLFGSKLPEVARNLGGTYRELRKNLNDFQREFQDWDKPDPRSTPKPAYTPETEKVEAAAPKFTPPPAPEGNPVEE
ncbi:MAG: twin-arginine translocase TatA/TatE family subunit [Pirellulales bacterium]